jgi:hypothetical protein
VVIETDFAGFTGIKSTVGIEEGTRNRQAQMFNGFEGTLQMGFQVISIVMIARYDAGGGDHIAITVCNGQDVAGLGPFSHLVGHALPAFLGNGLATVQIQDRQIQVPVDCQDAVLLNLRQAAVCAPFAPMVIHGLPTWLPSPLPLLSISRDGQSVPLTSGVQPIQDQIENAYQRRLTHVPSLSGAQIGQDMLLELFWRYTFGDGAYDWILCGRSFSQS